MENKTIGNTAIVVFIRALKEEARIKSFSYSNSRRQSISVIKEMNHHAIQLSKAVGVPVIIGNENIQKGDTFGERLNSVCEYSFDQGFENLILIGNDCLCLDSSDLIKVENQLRQKDVVLGPTDDGGIYLLGISKKAFDAIDLVQQYWQRPKLFKTLHLCFEKNELSIEVLEIVEDVDDVFQLQVALSKLSPISFLRKKISSLLALSFHLRLDIQQYIYKAVLFSNSLRGPPRSI